MYLYSFDIERKTVKKENYIFERPVVFYTLSDMTLSFINKDYTEFNDLLNKVNTFILNNSFLDTSELSVEEITKRIKNVFSDFNITYFDYACGEWRIALEDYLKTKCNAELLPCLQKTENKNADLLQKYNLIELQSKLRSEIELLLDYDYKDYGKIHPLARYALFCTDISKTLTEKIVVFPNSYEEFTKGYSLFSVPFQENEDLSLLNKHEQSDDYNPQQIEFSEKNLRIVSGYEFNSLEELLSCEIFKMAQAGIKLRKCHNCGKYFVFKPTQPAKYCKNIIPGKNITCQQEGAQKEYIKTLNPISDIYMKAIRRMSNRMPSKKSGLRTKKANSDYQNWKKEQSEIMNTYKEKYQNAKDNSEKEIICQEYKSHIESVLSKK